MKIKVILAGLLSMFCIACTAKTQVDADGGALPDKQGSSWRDSESSVQAGKNHDASIAEKLALIAETERSSGFTPGMGLSESTIRERAGDFSGAVIAAYKELLWSYSYGNIKDSSEPFVTKSSIEEGLEKVKKLYADSEDNEQKKQAVRTAEALLLFSKDNYWAASVALNEIFTGEIEADSFVNWLKLVCKIESGKFDKFDSETYSIIRARYASFPAYWYYGARAFNTSNSNICADYSEQCINLNPKGPYSDDARVLLAAYVGLDKKESRALMSRKEIEDTITQAINRSDPEMLSVLLPLISLRDNPFTLFAYGAMRAIYEENVFKDWFLKQESIAKKNYGKDSRLSDRLAYIVRRHDVAL